MDWNFIIHSIPIFAKALILTLKISFLGIFGAMILGFLVNIVLYYKIPLLAIIAKIYIEFSRNTPLLIHLFFLYFGLGQVGFNIDAFHCAIIGVIFLGGSYMAESFRLGFLSVTKTQIESAMSLGFNKLQIMRYIILPQSLGISMPSLGANIIFLLKETSVVSAIALADLVFVTKDLIGAYYKTSETLFMLVMAYLIVLLPLSLYFSWLEKKYKQGKM
ncbi:polar amino acid ABC transporter permease [Helicobacter anseris]|uniref:Polar amino acid ABC transporter permease n=1 Tax=Helicobacter anseris TaxID=375926 RepID=A0A3D8J7R5_9HELI|nr:amino acid ABC transporter permease [Helicobacter anseris]RDU73553.1 polar amino acid ABC transporter permease [Helicobacter anseris]